MAAMQGEPPAVARRRVRLAIRSHRLSAGLNQSELAERLSWSLSKVQRIESGEVGVSITDLRALLQVVGVDDAAEVQRLAEDAEISRRQRWYERPEYRRHLTKSLRQLLQFESEAAAIRVYQPFLVPGVLQTPTLADHVLKWWDTSLTDDDRRVRYDVRMLRKRQIVEPAGAPEYYLILDESVLMRRVGGAKVMAEQLQQLKEFSSLPNIHIRVLPLEKGAQGGILGPFQVIGLGDAADGDAVLYREFYNRDSVTHDAEEILFHRYVFEKLWADAWGEEDTRDAITARAWEVRKSAD